VIDRKSEHLIGLVEDLLVLPRVDSDDETAVGGQRDDLFGRRPSSRHPG
jgi:hypothetical protein